MELCAVQIYKFVNLLYHSSCPLIDPYHAAAMLSLGGIKGFVFARRASARREFSARLAVQKQCFLFS